MRKLVASLVALVAGVAIVMPGQALAQAKFALKGQSSHPATANFHLIFKLWAEQMEKMSGGRF